MNGNKGRAFPWTVCGLIIIGSLLSFYYVLGNKRAGGSTLDVAIIVIFEIITIAYAVMGTLIISRQPRNVIGLLMLLPTLFFASPAEAYINQFSDAPTSPTWLLFLSLWFADWSWLLGMIPLLFIMVLFPTGHPPSPRWRWLLYFNLAISVIFVLEATFVQEMGPVNGDWTVRNPIGFLSRDWLEIRVVSPWFVGLPPLTILSILSLFVRYRRARAVEREQIRWLFYACVLFTIGYVSNLLLDNSAIARATFVILVTLGMLAIPTAIGIAVLRYRLWDIDIIIRRTLIYTVLTTSLALLYALSIILLQAIFDGLTGQQSPIVIVASTLIIAAIFTPLRHRVQDVIDRRFFRRKYNAQQVLAAFARTARDETDLEKLTSALSSVVTDTMQPDGVQIWLRHS